MMMVVMVVVVDLGYIRTDTENTNTNTRCDGTMATRSGCGEAGEIETGKNRKTWSTANWIKPEGQTIARDKHTGCKLGVVMLLLTGLMAKETALAERYRGDHFFLR